MLTEDRLLDKAAYVFDFSGYTAKEWRAIRDAVFGLLEDKPLDHAVVSMSLGR